MKQLKRASSLVLALIITFGFSGNAFAANKKYTLEEAVMHGIENSSALDQVEVEIGLARVSKSRGRYSARKLRRGDRDLSKGSSELGEAKSAWEAGIIPQDVNLPDGTIIEAGTSIDSVPDFAKDQIKKGVEQGFERAQEQLDSGDYAILSALDQAGATISSALDFASLDALSLDSSANLIELMPDVVFEVTQASFDIYKNNIALLIQKNYYDVLQAQEMLKVRKRAMDRGAKQYEFLKASYEEGMKAKDDLLMAELYYKSTKIAYEQTKGDLESAKVELMKNANIDMETDIELESVMKTASEKFNLNEGLEMGMKNRLEIKKSVGEVLINNTNFEETKKSYPSNTFQYQEAELLKEKAGVQFEQAKQEVESSIRKSYTLVENTANMLDETDGMINSAKENLEIAQMKYDEGYGVNTILLGNLNLQDSAGTIVEVLAAQEKLSEVEESIVKITYAYNLSRMQYKNNIGDFIY